MTPRAPRCPRCGAALTVQRRWFGLVRRLVSPCPTCGAKIGFDTAGEAHVIVDPAKDAQ